MGGRQVRLYASIGVLALGVALVAAPGASAQETHAEGGTPSEHAGEATFRHFVSFFGGLATHTDAGDTGGAMGVSYAYKLSHRWAVGLKLEYVTSSIERDIVVLVGASFEPVERLELTAAVGPEWAQKDREEHGELHRERETEAMIRLGAAYGFALRDGVSVGPEINTDISGSRVTLVYGLLFSVGL